MARGRMIDKRISKSKKLAALKHDRSRMLYFMILPHLDCEGRYSGDPEDIKEDCVPKLIFPLKKIAESVVDMANVGLLVLFEHKNEAFIQFTRFSDFQLGIRKDREAPSSIPPPQKIQTNSGVPRSYSALSLSLSLSLRKEGKKKKEEIFFNYEKKKFLNIDIEDMAGWKDAYPAVDVDQQLKEMREWLLADPSREKSNYKKFINNWLSSEQSKAAGKPSYQDKRKKELDDWEKKPIED